MPYQSSLAHATVTGAQASYGSGQQPSAKAPAFVPRTKKPLVITDKDGNPIDITGGKKDKEKEKAAAEKEKAEKEKAEKEKAEQERLAKEKLEAEAAIAAEQAEKEAEEKAAAEAEAAKMAEEERIAAEKKAEEEKAKAKAEAEAEAAEKAEAERLAKEKEAAAKAAQSKPSTLQSRLDASQTDSATTTAPHQPLRPGGTRRLGPSTTPSSSASGALTSASNSANDTTKSKKTGVRHVYTKAALLSFRDDELSCTKPDGLPDMTITLKGDSKSSGGGGGHHGQGGGGGDSSGRGQRRQSSQWARGSQAPHGGGGGSNGDNRGGDHHSSRSRRQSSSGGGGGGDWTRGQAPPKQQRHDSRGGRGGRGGGRHQQNDLYDGPVEPLTRSANRWKPQKDVSAVAITEKKVKSILNKMTKEKFDRLSQQMVELPIESSQVLQVMINTVFEKAIDEPNFGDMYADLCVLMAQSTDCSQFVHIVHGESSSGDRYFHWSSDISTNDAEVVGPLSSEDECVQTALMPEPPAAIPRGKLELELVTLRIVDGVFIKILRDVKSEDGECGFYAVFIPQSDMEECGQQISELSFMTEKDCLSNARKLNSFKRLLLYKCEDEFKKQDIYVEWKAEKKEFEATKSSLTDTEAAEKEEEIEFRRIKIKKQMLGNIRFIGELFKKSMLKEPVMHECVMSLLKLRNTSTRKNSYTFVELEDNAMDEEDHEALCQLFATIGKTIDSSGSREAMDAYFAKIAKMSKNKKLNSRSRFMYQDLIDLRKNNWKSRRKEESAKTLDEIKKDFEREERAAQRQSAVANAGYRGGGGGRRDDGRRDGRRQTSSKFMDNRDRRKQQEEAVDEDGFATVPVSRGRRGSSGPSPSILQRKQMVPPAKKQQQSRQQSPRPSAPQKRTPAPLDTDELKKRIKGVRAEYMSLKDEKEVILCAEEWSGTDDWSDVFCTESIEKALDCKEDERQAIISMFKILCKKSMLPEKSFEVALTEILEFMDDFAVDIPKVYEYMGDVVANLLRFEAIKFSWLCDLCANFLETTAPGQSERTLVKIMKCLVQLAGNDGAKAICSPSETAILKVISSDQYNAVKTW